MRDYGQIVTTLKSTPWLITEDGLSMILQIVEMHMDGKVSLAEIEQRVAESQRNRPATKKVEGDLGVMPLHGPMFPKANMMTMLSGATSMEQWQADFKSLMANDRVSRILLDIDSPGGSAYMVTETSELVRQAREVKPIYAVANPMAASAAMNIASQATELFMTPSGYVGSVGALAVHTDDSGLKEKLGIKETVVSTPRFKAVMHNKLDAEGTEWIGEKVVESYQQFVQDVAAGRRTTIQDVMENYGEGGIVGAKQALEAGMVDGIKTYDDVLNTLLDGGGTLVEPASGGSSGSSVAFMSLSYDKEKEHSEPGTGQGGEPAPRIPPESEHIDDWKNNGGRLERPPNIPELEESVMNREQLVALAAKLGVEYSADTTDEALATLVSEKLDSTLELVAEIKEGTQQAVKQVEFAQQYPEQAERLRKLEEDSNRLAANEFAAGLSSFELGEEGKATLSFKLSALAQTAVRDSHLKLAQGNLLPDDLATLVKNVASGMVPQGESGSSRFIESTDGVPAGTSRVQARQLFTDKVTEIMESDQIDRKKAIAIASERFPELAQAYASL